MLPPLLLLLRVYVSQVINGLLLPFVVICLLLTLNDPASMPALPSVPSTIASKNSRTATPHLTSPHLTC